MQLNGYSLNVINSTIKDTLQVHNSENKSKGLEPLKLFIQYQKGVVEKYKGTQENIILQQLTTDKNKRIKRTNRNKTSEKKWKLQEEFMK